MSYYQKMRWLFELASLVGLGSIPAEKRNPLELETRGIGELILQLVDQGLKRSVWELAVLQRMMVGLGWLLDLG